MAEQLLLVDDNRPFRDCVAEALSIEGYATVCVASAAEAWAFLQVQRVRVVITDNAMRGADASDTSGLELAMRVKQTFPDTLVVMLSGMPPSRAAEVCDAVLVKTDGVPALLKALRKLRVLPNSPEAVQDI